MSTLATRVSDLALRISTECKSLRTMVNGNAADLTGLTTQAKGSLVASINELKTALDAQSSALASQINDGVTTTSNTWSSFKTASAIASAVSQAKNDLMNGAPGALDTLKELADAIGNDANFAGSITTALANRVRFDASQTLTAPQAVQARANIGAQAAAEIGNTDTDFVAIFVAGLA